ncbi:MAG: ATP-dependent zinc protease family protein [Planctomycetaceae bacterium]
MPKSRKPKRERVAVGWREWVALPDLAVPAIKAKMDTGARSSAIHAFRLRTERRNGVNIVRFDVHPFQRTARETVSVEAEVLEYRNVKTSGGHVTRRPVILTTIELFGRRWTIELTLANRDTMGFRMLLGREAIRGRFLVDPGRSYLAGKPGASASGRPLTTDH